jgi:hypothetical protein
LKVENPASISAPSILTPVRIKYLLIVLVSLIGKFLFASEFGFYEDDYLQILPFYGTRWDQVLGLIWSDLRTWPHGEPVGFAIADLHAYFVTRFSTLAVPYLLGFLLVALNGCLFYRFARRLGSDFAAFIAACLFVLYPVDTSEQIIMNQPWQLLNLTIVLLAFLCYRKRMILSYGLGLCSLLIYEHFFFPFAAAPFLIEKGDKFSLKRCILHGVFIVSGASGVIVVRSLIGEHRAQGVLTDPGEVLWKVPSAIGIGLTNAVVTTFSRIVDVLLQGDFFSWSIIFGVGLALVLGLRSSTLSGEAAIDDYRARKDLLIAGGGAIFAAAAGYVLAFRPDDYPPVLNLGRLSGFNAPASIGVCLLVACGISYALQTGRMISRIVRWASVFLVGCLTAVGIYIQRVDYVASWAHQKDLLRQLMATSGTWKADTICVIDLDHSDLKPVSTPGFSSSWLCFDLCYLPRYLIDFPALPKGTLPPGTTLHPSEGGYSQLSIRLLDGNMIYPRAIGYSRYMDTTKMESGGMRVDAMASDPLFRIVLKDGNFQLFEIHDQKLQRVEKPTLTVGNAELRQDSVIDSGQRPLPLSRAGKILLGEPTLWPSVDGGKQYPTTLPFKDLK